MPYQYQPYQFTTYVPSYQPPTMQQMVSQGYRPSVQQGIPGRTVASPDEIQVQEVPTDGSMALFPSNDGSCVYGKRWNPNGKIDTFRYVMEGQEQQADPLKELDGKLDRALQILGDMAGVVADAR